MVDGKCSRPAPVISGVPQGTVLGPILFILYINDLELVLSHSRSSSFADDTRLSGSISNVEDTVKLQADLNTVVDWSKKNNMALHEDKFELMSYRTHSSRLLRVLPFADEFCEYDTPAGCTLSPTKTVKDLGVYLSSDLTWSYHIATIIKNARKVAAWTLGVFSDRSQLTMIRLYKSMIRCHLEYCSPLWDPTSISDIQKLESVQRYFTEKIVDCNGLDYWERLKKLNLQSLQRRRERYSIIHMWKIYNNLVPNDLNIEFYDSGRLGIMVKLPSLIKTSTSAAQTTIDNSFGIRASRLWNKIPGKVTRIRDLEKFKEKLGEFLRKFPDQPLTSGYSSPNNNSLLEWTMSSTGILHR